MPSAPVHALLNRLEKVRDTSPETAPILDRLRRDRKRRHMAQAFWWGYTSALQCLRGAIQGSPRATPEALLDLLKAAQRADDLDLIEGQSQRHFLSQKSLDEDHAWRLGFQALITLYARMIHEPA